MRTAIGIFGFVKMIMQTTLWIVLILVWYAARVIVAGWLGVLLPLGILLGGILQLHAEPKGVVYIFIGGAVGLVAGVGIGIYRTDFRMDWR